ncbi:HNH endonuclease [Bacillus phage CM1]|nr:HNH endonuclease [Bacillus phage CM1]
MVQESWKSLKGIVECGDNYEVSTLGNVRNSTTGKQLSPRINNGGYLQLGLRYQGKRKFYVVHRLVALAFIPNPDNKPEVNHKRGKEKTNNRVDNLEWATTAENIKHAFDTGLNSTKGEHHSLLTESDVRTIKEMLRDDKLIDDIAKTYGVNRNIISNIKRGASWSHIKVDGFTENNKRSVSGKKKLSTLFSRLTEEQVIEIRKIHKTGECTQVALAAKYGVSRYVISDIVKGKTWKHLL